LFPASHAIPAIPRNPCYENTATKQQIRLGVYEVNEDL